MKKLVLAILAASVAASTSGCATIFQPGHDFVPVQSKPEGAAVKLDGMPVGKTPVIVAVPRSGEGVLAFDLPGYETLTVNLDKVFNGVTLLNILWLGWPIILSALIVDVATGNIGKYSTDRLNVELVPSTPK